MKTLLASSITLALGIAVGAWFTNPQTNNTDTTAAPSILYWVAPMDANYRRDQPGKSPMGMDLIPVYADATTANDPGLVTISARVENNLGVRTQTAVLRPFIAEINTVGMLEFNQDTLWQINSRVSGWVDKLYINSEGEYVNKGQKLLSLYSPELIKAQEELLNTLRIGNKTLIASAKHRLSALGISQNQINQVNRNKKVLQNITIYAPESGYITKLSIREGAYISPSTQIVEAGQLTEIWLQAEVFESQAGLVQVGDKAEMQLDSFPGKTWLGEVDYIYPVLNAVTRTLKVRVKIANTDKQLKPNMFARLKLISQIQTDSVQVPREAIIRAGNFDRIVLAKGNGQYQSVKITLGRESAGYVEVLAGLNAGDNVVTSAQFLIDSESSLTADFARIGARDNRIMEGMDHSDMTEPMDHSQMQQSQKSATTTEDEDLSWLDFDDEGAL